MKKLVVLLCACSILAGTIAMAKEAAPHDNPKKDFTTRLQHIENIISVMQEDEDQDIQWESFTLALKDHDVSPLYDKITQLDPQTKNMLSSVLANINDEKITAKVGAWLIECFTFVSSRPDVCMLLAQRQIKISPKKDL